MQQYLGGQETRARVTHDMAREERKKSINKPQREGGVSSRMHRSSYSARPTLLFPPSLLLETGSEGAHI